MPPIHHPRVDALAAALSGRGVALSAVEVISAEADEWRYRIKQHERSFEIGFSREIGAWAQETTPGRMKHLTSNDHPPVNSTTAAFDEMVRLVAHAMRDPAFPPRDPPVI